MLKSNDIYFITPLPLSQHRLTDVSAGVAEQNRRREEALHALEVMQREKEHAAETERIRLQSKIAEIAEEVSKKILQKEMGLREESTRKYAELEQVSAVYIMEWLPYGQVWRP